MAFSPKPIIAAITAIKKIALPKLVWTGSKVALTSFEKPGNRKAVKPAKN